MARTWQEIDAAKTEADLQDLQTSVQGYPPGFVEGGELTLNDSAQVEVAPIALQVGSRNVKINETVIINEEHWNIGGQTVNRLATKWYNIYISELGTFHVSHLEATFDPDLYGYYHPTIARHRGIGRFYIDDNIIITRVARLGPHRLSITDDLDRYIEISADKGLYAEDATGTVIHDIPNAPILSDMIYGGHIIFMNAPAAFESIIHNPAASTNTTDSNASGIVNHDLTSDLPTELTNVKGIIVCVDMDLYIDTLKVNDNSTMVAYARYSLTYNTAPGTYNHLMQITAKAQGNSGAGTDWEIRQKQQVFIPVVYSGSTPYITWEFVVSWANMTTANNFYYGGCWLFLQGVLV